MVTKRAVDATIGRLGIVESISVTNLRDKYPQLFLGGTLKDERVIVIVIMIVVLPAISA